MMKRKRPKNKKPSNRNLPEKDSQKSDSMSRKKSEKSRESRTLFMMKKKKPKKFTQKGNDTNYIKKSMENMI